MAIVANRLPVNAPVLTGPRYSLLTIAERRDRPEGPNGDHWENGIVFDPESCGFACARLEACGVGSLPKCVNLRPGSVEFDPFWVQSGHQCSTFGTPGVADQISRRSDNVSDFTGPHETRALRELAACKAGVTEYEFWTGDLRLPAGCSSQWLASPEAVILGGDDGTTQNCFTPLKALQAIDDCLAARLCGEQVMIHMPRSVLGSFIDGGFVFWNADLSQWLTYSGHLVVPGEGYPGTQPNGFALNVLPDTSFIYVTTPVFYYESEAFVFSDVDHRTNDVEAIAECVIVVAWDKCVHLGLCVNVCA